MSTEESLVLSHSLTHSRPHARTHCNIYWLSLTLKFSFDEDNRYFHGGLLERSGFELSDILSMNVDDNGAN